LVLVQNITSTTISLLILSLITSPTDVTHVTVEHRTP
jgi:hypothetical protein